MAKFTNARTIIRRGLRRSRFVQYKHAMNFAGAYPAIVADLRMSPRMKLRSRASVQQMQLLQHADDRRIETAFLPVGDLDRDAEPVALDADRLHAFGADLGNPISSTRPHQREVAP